MATSRILGAPESCLNLAVSSDASACTNNTEHAPERRGTALPTRALLCLLSMLLLGGLAQSALQAQTAYFSGAVTTLGGGFSSPWGVALDGSSNIYVSDSSTDTVYKMPPGCASSSCVTTLLLSNTLSDTTALAIDGSGNLYVANTDLGQVNEVPPSCTSSGCITALPCTNAGYRVSGLAVDGSGNVYCATGTSNGVWKIPAGCTLAKYHSGACLPAILGGGFVAPEGVALDASGNIYIADTGANAVKEMPLSCTYAAYTSGMCTITTLPLAGSFYHPDALAIDGSGNVYVADEGPGSVVKEIPAGCASSSCVTFLGGGFNELTGLALDGRGNVYVADSGNDAVQEIIPPGHGVPFGAVPVGSTGPTLTLYFTFTGTDSGITSSVLTQGANGLDFADAGTGTCDTNGTLHQYSATTTCTMNVTFSPKYAGARYGAVQLSDSSGVIATAYIYGTGTGPQIAFEPASIVPLGGGFTDPEGVAVDGSGNIYVTDFARSVVNEMSPGCASASCVTVLGGGFSGPEGAALDGSGNVYATDYDNNAVKEMPPGCASSSCVTSLGGGFSGPVGMAVDGSGNVYVADAGNNAVKEMPPGCASSSCVNSLGGGFASPHAVAVDGSGNVYVADFSNNAVKEMPPGCASSSCVTVLGGGFNHPLGVAVDGSGNVYVADFDNSAVKEMPAGCASSSCVTVLGRGFSYPAGVALDGSGNIYVADTYNNAVKELNAATPPSFTFASTKVGSQSSDSPQTATLMNIGNAPLSFPVPGSGQNPSISANFTLDSSTTCPEVLTSSSAGTLAAGATCALAVDFIPATTGAISGAVVLTDNNLNASNVTQTIELNGTGLEAAVSVSIGTSPAGLSFSINGTPYTTTQTPSLTIGTQYTLATTSPQAANPGVQYVFSQWSDGTTSLTDTLTPTASTTSDVADFTAQYLLTVTAAGSGGAIGASTSPNGFYNAGTVQTITATPNAGYYFTGWTGANAPSDIANATSASTTVTMNGPENLTANFAPHPSYVVATLSDDTTGNAGNCSPPSSSCTLRDAITAAEANNGGVGAITFASGLTGTVTLTSALPALSGQITITGPGARNLTISGGNSQTVGSIFTVNNDAVVAFSGITIANGNNATGNGGGIANAGTLTLSNSTVSGNTASGNGGGGIYSSGTLVVSGSSISGNTAYYGAGIAARSGSVAVSSSTISGNASFYGAGIDFGGGALTLTVVNSTIFGNTGNYGGGIHVYSGTVTVSSTTISGNTGIQDGAGIYNQYGALTVNNSILAGDTGYDECAYTACPSNGSNGNVVGVAPNLAPLGNYGGPTQTLLPLPGSAAICGGLAANIPTGVTTDQRGYPNTNTSYLGYSSNSPCVDVGAVQTNYSLSFTTDPPSTGILPTLAMSPAPAVTVTESGNALAGGSASVSVTDANSDLTTSPATATTSTSNGQATFGNLIFAGATSNDTLTALLALNPNSGLNLTTISTSFSVVAPVIATIGTSPAGLSFSINGTPYTTTQTPSLTVGNSYTLATRSPQTLAATPGVEYVFSQWSDGTTSLTDTLTPTTSTNSDVAMFNPLYQLTVIAGTGGTIAASTSPNGFYNDQTVQTITATPNAGYYFTGWTGANSPGDIASATSATTTVTMNGPENLTANFAPIPGYRVTTLNDDATGNAGNCSPPSSSCTLRDSIAAAEANSGGAGTVTFASGLTGTIALTSALPALNGEIAITGPGARNLIVSGGNSQTVGSIFTVNPGANAAISGITISNGVTAGYYASGGGIANGGTLTVSDCTISSNIAVGYGNGGGIVNSGTLTIIDSTVSGNFANSEAAGGDGGGIFNNGGSLTMINSTVSGNFAFYIGGGILNNGGTLMMINSTVSGNTSGPSGGVGGGILSNAGGTVTLLNTIVAGNASDSYSGDDCDSCGTQSPYNLISTPSNIINPMLASLGNHGGPTQTMLPLPGSAAICAASSALIPAGVTMDQRGFPNSTTYNTTACYDLGAVQTNYALSFNATQEPPSSGTVPSLPMSPAPAVTITESGSALIAGSVSVSVTDANSDLTTSPATATTSTSNGQAAFSNLIFTGTTSNDTLTASLALNTNNGLNLTTSSTSFSVAAGTPTVTWPTATAITYGQALASSTLSGGSASFNNASVPGSFAFTNPSAVPSAGTQMESVTFTPSDTSAYKSVSGAVSVLVNKAMPTVTFTGAPANAPYEGTFAVTATTNASTTAVIAASGSCSIAGTTVTITAPSGACSLTATWAADSNYLAASATQSITATKATPLITWATPAAITYGTALSGTQLDATATYNGATVAGTFVYTPAKGTVLTTGTQTLSANFTPTKAADFTGASASVTLQVNQATPKITWAKPPAITYGTALSSTQLDATASVPGTFAYSPAAGAILIAGSQALSVTFTPTDAVDYTPATDSVTLTVSQAAPTVTWATPAEITYGTALSSTQLDATASVSGTFVYSPTVGAIENGGSDKLSVTFTPTDSVDYTKVTASVTLQVNSAIPTITWATPAAITYGTALSGTQLDATAAYNGATVAGTFVYTPAKGTVLAAGAQTLSVTFTPTNTINYAAPSSASVTLQVNQATPTITWAKPAAITYGTALSSTQLDATASVAGTFKYSPAAGTVLGGGTQTLSVTFTPTNTTDYTTPTDSVTITVNTTTSTTTITSNTPNPAPVGEVVTVDFSVTGANGVPTESVTVTASTGESCSGSLGVAATGSCTLTFTATGSPKLTAVYGGDSNFKGSTSAKVTETVN